MEFKLSKKLEKYGMNMTQLKISMLALCREHGDASHKFWQEFFKQYPCLEGKELIFNSRAKTVTFVHDSDEKNYLEVEK